MTGDVEGWPMRIRVATFRESWCRCENVPAVVGAVCAFSRPTPLRMGISSVASIHIWGGEKDWCLFWYANGCNVGH